MKRLWLILFLFLVSCENFLNDGSRTNSKPNILLIIADDMGLDATPGYNIGTIKPTMPNIENLINNGIRFNNVWAYPNCTPTRSSIISGKYGFRVNVTKLGDELSTSEISLQKYLNNNSSYTTAVIGKWHLSNNINHPINMGVNYYAGLLNGGVQSYNNWKFSENGQTTTSKEYITTKFSDLAISWLENRVEPWFLWLAYTAPHTPFHLPPNNLHTKTNLPSDRASIDANTFPYYMAMIEAMDTEIGRVLSSLSKDVLNNTIIIFIGDNGSLNQVAQQYNSKRVKGTVYQGGINIPIIISGLGVSRINQTENALINTTDLFATILDIAGINNNDINDSKSFKGLLSDKNSFNRDYVYSEIGKRTGGSDYTIRNATHKYIKFDHGNEALYNLSKNPFENPNLLSSNQLPLNALNSAIKEELVSKLVEIRQ